MYYCRDWVSFDRYGKVICVDHHINKSGNSHSITLHRLIKQNSWLKDFKEPELLTDDSVDIVSYDASEGGRKRLIIVVEMKEGARIGGIF